MPPRDVSVFVSLTFLISLPLGLLAFWLFGAATFETLWALPLLLPVIWSPNIAALLVSGRGERRALLGALWRRGTASAWLAALLPLSIAAGLGLGLGASPPGLGVMVPLVLVNLIMGPLGEELGWRGYLLPRLVPSLGLLGASAAVGAVWGLWHLPLWWLPSPQQAIPYGLFFVTCVCFSVVMSAIWQAGGRALGPMVLFHLATNVGVGALEVSGAMGAAHAYAASLPVLALAALVCAAWMVARDRAGPVLGAAR